MSYQMSSTIANASSSFVFMVDVLHGGAARCYIHGGVPEAATGPPYRRRIGECGTDD
jgi:hypothetical protein